MGYRGKLWERQEARRLRAQNLTLADIAKRLAVSKSSVSLWVRDGRSSQQGWRSTPVRVEGRWRRRVR